MDRLDAMRAFVEAARGGGGLAAAGRRLGLSRSQVSKLVQALEARLGVQLLIRSNRAVAPTDAGREYLERAIEILERVELAEHALAGRQREPRGRLRVNAPMSFGRLRLARILPRFLAAHPGIELQVALDDRFIDPVAAGFDVTIRIAAPGDSSLVGRRLMDVTRVACAAPAYLAGRAALRHPRDLADHACLQYGNLASGGTWIFRRRAETARVETAGRLCSNNGEVLRDAAIAGAGIALLPEFIVEDALREGQLEAVLADWHPPPLCVHALYGPTRRLARTTRVFIDFLVAELGDARPGA